MKTRSVRKLSIVAAFSALTVLGLWTVAEPAFAGTPGTEECLVSGTPGLKTCGVVQVEVIAAGQLRCGPPGTPFYCGETVSFRMRTRYQLQWWQFNYRVLEANAHSEQPSTCFLNATSTWSAWCGMTTGSPPQSIRIRSVTSNIRLLPF
jgi:hypothetical protein